MLFSRIVFVLAYNPTLWGPVAPMLGHSAGEVVADVHARIEATAIATNGGNTETYAGDTLEDERAAACQRLHIEGRPLGVELWMAESYGMLGAPGSDATVIYYGDGEGSQEAAEIIASKIAAIDIGVRLWGVSTQHDPSLPSTCRYVRVGLGNIAGVLGAPASATETWRNYIALQVMDGIVEAVTLPIE